MFPQAVSTFSVSPVGERFCYFASFELATVQVVPVSGDILLSGPEPKRTGTVIVTDPCSDWTSIWALSSGETTSSFAASGSIF